MHKDSNLGTILVAFILCVTCSIVVASAAVGLKDRQEFNKKLDIKKNILVASGLVTNDATQEEILSAYEKIETQVIDLNTGLAAEGVSPETYDATEAVSNPKQSDTIEPIKDIAGIKRREKYAKIYFVKDENGGVSQIILPIRGKGLWSTLYGFLAVSPDFTVTKGITFYQHAETPGLGGEVDNPNWQAQFDGKMIYGDGINVKLKVAKGRVDPLSADANSSVDGLSGATITSNGVTNMLRYWLGEQGFGAYVERVVRANQSE